MEDSSAIDGVVIGIVSFLALIIPLIFFPAALMGTNRAAGNAYKRMMGSLHNAEKRAANSASSGVKKAAMNSKYGNAYQQWKGQRKNINQLKGQEALRKFHEKTPGLTQLMGGPGGGKFAARIVNAEQRKHDAEQTANLRQDLTPSVADGAARGKDYIAQSMANVGADGKSYWKATGKEITAQDRESISKLQHEGYMGQDYSVKGDGRFARAALSSIMTAEIAGPENVAALAKMNGTDQRANALFTEQLHDEAAKHGYKNLQYGSVTNGEFTQYHIKEPEDILASGITNIQKDALDPSYDKSMLEAIAKKYEAEAKEGRGDEYIRRIMEQTKHIDKEKVMGEVAKQLKSSVEVNIRQPDGTIKVELRPNQDLTQLRQALRSPGTTAAPARFTAGAQPQSAEDAYTRGTHGYL